MAVQLWRHPNMQMAYGQALIPRDPRHGYALSSPYRQRSQPQPDYMQRRSHRWRYDDDPLAYIDDRDYSPRRDVPDPEELMQEFDDWAVASGELTVPGHALQLETLREIMYKLLRFVQNADMSDGPAVGDEIYHELQNASRMDVMQPVSMPMVNERATWYTQHLFRVFAMISAFCRSEATAEVLHYFLRRNHEWIVRQNSHESIKQWARAVLVSSMRQAEKRDCLSLLLVKDGRILDEMLDTGLDGVRPLNAEALQVLHSLEMDMERGERRRDPWSSGNRNNWSHHRRNRNGGRRKYRDEYDDSDHDHDDDRHLQSIRDDMEYHELALEQSRQQLKELSRSRRRERYLEPESEPDHGRKASWLRRVRRRPDSR